ncbi:MAG: gamma-glutamyltransferase [Verrucomicrobiales bacterium]|nr:gamma-glutamyltransferase [Verrucomicrobiales bacterium]
MRLEIPCLVLLLLAQTLPAAQHGAVATVDPIATDAAVAAMKKGGNAIDGAVAAGLTLGVVNGYNSGIGGGCFMMLRLANGKIIAIDGRETAPAAARRDMYLRDGKPDTQASKVGALASGVPGALAAYDHALKHHGKLPLKWHLENAARIAEMGFKIPPAYAGRIKANAPNLRRFKSSAALLLDAKSVPLQTGTLLRQPELAATYRAIAREGIGWFYGGPFAKTTENWMRANGGILTAGDFRNYKVKRREPIRTTYRGYEIAGMPPPSSGGVHVGQILNILENFSVHAMEPNSADFIHLTAESMKLAFADRAHWLGDADFAPVPRGLVDKKYSAKLAKQIRMDRAIDVKTHGQPPRSTDDLFNKHTTHFSVADHGGNWVACTATINTHFGSKVIIPGTGVFMNNEMDDFSVAPGTPNAFGLIGAEANAIVPGKRPLSSMSPTIVLKDGQPILAVGAAGGPTIITQTLLTIIHTLDFNRPLKEALAQPHFHHQWRPNGIRIEKQAEANVLAELKRRGHKLQIVQSMGATQAVSRMRGKLEAAHDPRLKGKAVDF